jgi:hypothetical protein
MPDHIGIVACSAEGAALCYRTICVEGAQLLGPHAHPEVSMRTHSLAEYMKCIYHGDWQGLSELMLSSADKLANSGADFLIWPDNTIHRCFVTSNRAHRCLGCTSLRSSPHTPSYLLRPENALEAFTLFGGGAFIAVHWGTFALALPTRTRGGAMVAGC